MIPSVLLVISVVWAVVQGQIKLDASGRDGAKTMTFKTPQMTEEETESNFMPEKLKCDACNAIAFQFHKHFDEFNSKHKSYKSKLPESEIIDLAEKVCHHDTYNNYGVKEVDGINRLSGEGLEAEGAAAILSGGGKWPGRLSNLCASFLDEIGETEIYDLYLKGLNQAKQLQRLMCHGDGILGSCSKQQNKKRKIHTEL